MLPLHRLGFTALEAMLAHRAAVLAAAPLLGEAGVNPLQWHAFSSSAQQNLQAWRSQQTAALALEDEDDDDYQPAACYQPRRDRYGRPLPATGPSTSAASPATTQTHHIALGSSPQELTPLQNALQDGTAVSHVAAPLTAFEKALQATAGPITLYAKGRLEGLYRRDPLQEVTVTLLQQLYDQLVTRLTSRRHPSGLTLVDNVSRATGSSAAQPASGGWWSKISSLLNGNGATADAAAGGRKGPQGLYMYGGVGSGKTMLMDLFVEAAPREFKLRRTHYHDFMLEVHSRLQRHAHEQDPLTAVANDISRKTKVLCLDELFVTDVADAMILHRLFARLWDNGLVLVATSNRKPDALYEGGLQRSLFLPFIARLQEACIIHDMASPTDYRRLAHHEHGLYFVTPDKNELLHARFVELCNNRPVTTMTLPVAMGRTLHIPEAGGCIAKFDFADLCEGPLGAADYIALTNSFHTVAVSNVPVVTPANRAAAYRLVTLVDVLYEHKTRVLMSAEALPHELFAHVISNADAHKSSTVDEQAVVDDNLAFAKDRTVSRMIEMGSHEYLEAHAQRHAPELLLALREADKVGAAQARTTC